jgi:hypothetical protein
MNHDDSRRHHPARSHAITRATAASSRWCDAELAMNRARHSFEGWLAAGHEDGSTSAMRHAYCTHEALHEAVRAITMLIETIRDQAATLTTTPAHDTHIPSPAPVITRC